LEWADLLVNQVAVSMRLVSLNLNQSFQPVNPISYLLAHEDARRVLQITEFLLELLPPFQMRRCSAKSFHYFCCECENCQEFLLVLALVLALELEQLHLLMKAKIFGKV
jgi:hypothetical protein